jgi:hypothetical protein
VRELIKYTCSCCGQEHEQWPALAYTSPTNYNNLSEEDKQNIGTLTGDFCTIIHPDKTNKFILCTLSLKIIAHCQTLEYGLWVSLSDKSYEDYSENFKNENHQAQYFGWLCNDLPDYTFQGSIPTTVFTRLGNSRPEIVPHRNFDHALVEDRYNGITKTEAEKRIKNMLQLVEHQNTRLLRKEVG